MIFLSTKKCLNCMSSTPILMGNVENYVVTFTGCIGTDHTGTTHGTKRKLVISEE